MIKVSFDNRPRKNLRKQFHFEWLLSSKPNYSKLLGLNSLGQSEMGHLKP